jgi:hypothetical protein
MDERATQLHNIARGYVHSLGTGNFDAIPYDNDAELRGPLCPGGFLRTTRGSEQPQSGVVGTDAQSRRGHRGH